jgi:hypothetical protein
MKEIVPGKQVVYFQNKTNFIRSKDEMFIVLDNILNKLHNSQLITGDDFYSLVSTINDYETNTNNVYLDTGVLSFEVVKEVLELFTKLPNLTDNNLRAIIYDFNIYNLQTKFIENIQIIIEISPIEPYYKPKIKVTNILNSFYSQMGREKYGVIDIIRIIMFFFLFIIAIKCYFEEVRHVKGLKAALSRLISIRYIIGFIVSFIGFITIIVKLVSFNSKFSEFVNITVNDGFFNNIIKIKSAKFISYKEIQIVESVVTGLLVYLVQAEIIMLFSYKARKFFLFMKWALYDTIIIIIFLLFLVLLLTQISHYFYGLYDQNYSSYGESFVRMLYSIIGESYYPKIKDKKGNESSAFFTLLLACLFILFNSLIEVVMIHNYRAALLLEGEKESKNISLEKNIDKEKV